MRKAGTNFHSREGFSLIEVIVGFVLIGVLAAISLPLFTSGIQGAVTSDQRLDALLELNAELQGQLDVILSTYQGEQFGNIPTSLSAYFSGVADISVSTQWVEFSGAGGAFSELVSLGETDHLRIELTHTAGPRLVFTVSDGGTD